MPKCITVLYLSAAGGKKREERKNLKQEVSNSMDNYLITKRTRLSDSQHQLGVEKLSVKYRIGGIRNFHLSIVIGAELGLGNVSRTRVMEGHFIHHGIPILLTQPKLRRRQNPKP